MIVIFGRNKSWISRIIRVWTASQWSHIGILDNDNQHVIEAKGPVGVVITPLDEFLQRYDVTERRYLPGDANKAKRHLGAPFDHEGIRGIWMRKFTHSPNAWFCSELVAHASAIVPDQYAHYQTPESLYRLTTKIP